MSFKITIEKLEFACETVEEFRAVLALISPPPAGNPAAPSLPAATGRPAFTSRKERVEAMTAYMRENPSATAAEVAGRFGTTPGAVYARRAEMKKNGSESSSETTDNGFTDSPGS